MIVLIKKEEKEGGKEVSVHTWGSDERKLALSIQPLCSPRPSRATAHHHHHHHHHHQVSLTATAAEPRTARPRSFGRVESELLKVLLHAFDGVVLGRQLRRHICELLVKVARVENVVLQTRECRYTHDRSVHGVNAR